MPTYEAVIKATNQDQLAKLIGQILRTDLTDDGISVSRAHVKAYPGKHGVLYQFCAAAPNTSEQRQLLSGLRGYKTCEPPPAGGIDSHEIFISCDIDTRYDCWDVTLLLKVTAWYQHLELKPWCTTNAYSHDSLSMTLRVEANTGQMRKLQRLYSPFLRYKQVKQKA